ncbi:MAG: SGNH/GDSL hydrolase family protein [Acidobacteriota bacterium]
MDQMSSRVRAGRLVSGVTAAAVAAAFLFLSGPAALAQSGDRWVGTWATAVVARPQPGLAPPRTAAPAGGPAAAVAPQCFGQAPSPQTAAAPAPSAPAAAAAPAGPGGPGGLGGGRGQAGGAGRGGAAPLNFNNQTLRQIVHTSLGGDRVRIVLSNAFGTSPLSIGAAHVAIREQDAAIVKASDRTVTFGASPSVNIPAGAVVVSDPVALTVPPFADLAIDVYLPGDTAASPSPLTTHAGAQQTSYVSPTGNHAGDADLPGAATTAAWFFLSRVEVAASQRAGAVVTFGDSITDGTRSTINTNNRWPDHLARRLQAQKIDLAVLNQGIAGNRVLADGAGVSALARFDRDVLAQSGVTHVIVLESINDIGQARDNACPSAADLIAAHRQLIERAHSRGLKIFGATLTPFEGAAYWTREGEAKRQAVNDWIRNGKFYDGVIDFDAAVRDPNAPTKLQPQFNPGDNLHLTDAGYMTMATAIDLGLFKKK